MAHPVFLSHDNLSPAVKIYRRHWRMRSCSASQNTTDLLVCCQQLIPQYNLLSANLIFAEDDDVADDNIDGVAQACVTIQFGDLASNRH